MTQEYPQPHKQTRGSFITLYKTRLFTAEQVWDMCHIGRCVEREKVLDIFLKEMRDEMTSPSEYIDWDSVESVYIKLRKGEQE